MQFKTYIRNVKEKQKDIKTSLSNLSGANTLNEFQSVPKNYVLIYEWTIYTSRKCRQISEQTKKQERQRLRLLPLSAVFMSTRLWFKVSLPVLWLLLVHPLLSLFKKADGSLGLLHKAINVDFKVLILTKLCKSLILLIFAQNKAQMLVGIG